MTTNSEYQKALAVIPESICSAKNSLCEYVQNNAKEPHPYKQMETVLEYALQRIDSKRKDYAMAARIILYDLHEILKVSVKEVIGRLALHYKRQCTLSVQAAEDNKFHVQKMIVMGESAGMDMNSERAEFGRLEHFVSVAAALHLLSRLEGQQ